MGFSRPVGFDGAAAILVCKSKRDLGRVSKLPRGGERSWKATGKIFFSPAPLGSLDTLPRSRSLLQTKMAAIPSQRTGLENPTEKYGDCEQSILYVLVDISSSYLLWSANFSFPATFYDEILRLMSDKLFSVCVQ